MVRDRRWSGPQSTDHGQRAPPPTTVSEPSSSCKLRFQTGIPAFYPSNEKSRQDLQKILASFSFFLRWPGRLSQWLTGGAQARTEFGNCLGILGTCLMGYYKRTYKLSSVVVQPRTHICSAQSTLTTIRDAPCFPHSLSGSRDQSSKSGVTWVSPCLSGP
jgi:hypothetical protein